jgi:tRNA dimethylallyltransferase
MMRALEVYLSTGNSIRSYRNKKPKKRDFIIRKYGIHLSKEILDKQINRRVDEMMGAGLLEEVKALQPYRELNALQTVGYAELFSHLDGNFGLDEAVNQIKKNTRQYAKRQMTWFRKDPSIQWFDPADFEKIIKS